MISLALSQEHAHEIFVHPEIYETITDDFSVAPEDFDLKPDIALVSYVNGSPAGCVALRSINGVKMEVHVQILPEYRYTSLLLGHEMMAWIWENTSAQKLVAEIAFKYENVKRYAEKMGFKVEGICTKGVQIDGALMNQWIMGVSKWD